MARLPAIFAELYEWEPPTVETEAGAFVYRFGVRPRFTEAEARAAVDEERQELGGFFVTLEGVQRRLLEKVRARHRSQPPQETKP